MLAQLNGAAAGQTVFHIHFHIIPALSGIDLKLHARDKADFEKLKALAAKIAAAVQVAVESDQSCHIGENSMPADRMMLTVASQAMAPRPPLSNRGLTDRSRRLGT